MTTKQDEWRVESDHMIITLYQGCTEVIKDYPAYDKTEVFNRIAATMNAMEKVKEKVKQMKFWSCGCIDEELKEWKALLAELDAIG